MTGTEREALLRTRDGPHGRRYPQRLHAAVTRLYHRGLLKQDGPFMSLTKAGEAALDTEPGENDG